MNPTKLITSTPEALPPSDFQELVETGSQAGQLLEQQEAPPDPDLGNEAMGAMVGRYRLLGELGEGTFGRVFRAEQTEPVHRMVALKIVKAGMDTREVIARFEAERQALAMMDHPHVAHVFDAGSTASGRPYFVMELVDGLPVTDFCDRYQLTTEERLRLFVKICHAVQHAHQKGLIHRDIKPSNILVSRSNGEPDPKIIDFGVAKALGSHKLTELPLYTCARQIIGTPAYMSPEQADPCDGDIDTRTDIYSLGVLLYELLAGVTPFDGSALHLESAREIRRVIREADPPKPSTRLRTLGTKSADISRHRRTDPASLSRRLHGDLDWIVMRAIEKDRRLRYQTVSSLVEDINRHLAERPVSAGPPSKYYRLCKFFRRHRIGTAVTVAGMAALIFSIAALSLGLIQAKRERDRAMAAEARAEQEAQKAENAFAVANEVNTFLIEDLLRQASPYRRLERNANRRILVERAAQQADSRFKGRPQIELRIRSTLCSVYRELGEYESARIQLERAKKLCHVLEKGPEDPEWLGLRQCEGSLASEEGRYDEARKTLEEILPIQRRVLGVEHPDTIATLYQMAIVRTYQGRLDEARKLCEEIIPVRRRILGNEHPDTLSTLHTHATILMRQGHSAEAQRLFEEIVASKRRVLGNEHPETLKTLLNLAVIHLSHGETDRALRELENLLPVLSRVMGNEHPHTLLARQNIAGIYESRREWAKACDLFKVIVSARRRALGSEHPDTLASIHSYASALLRMGKSEEACEAFEEIIPVWRRLRGSSHPDTVRSLCMLGWTHLRLNRPDGAQEALTDILSATSKLQELPDSEALSTIQTVSTLAGALGDWDLVADCWRKRIAITGDSFSAYHEAAILSLMKQDMAGYASKCTEMLEWIGRGNQADHEGMAAFTCLIAPQAVTDLGVCARLVETALKRKPTDNWSQLEKGMLDYRSGEFISARQRFESLASNDDMNVALIAGYFLTLSHQQLHSEEAAKAAFAKANRRLDPVIHRGRLLDTWNTDWMNIAAALTVRAEAEMAIFGRKLSPNVDATMLANARKAWQPVSEALARGRQAAVAGRWHVAVEAFEAALSEPSFDWVSANSEAFCIWNWMGVVFARAGDRARYEAVCRRMIEGIQSFEPDGLEGAKVAKACTLMTKSPQGLVEKAHELMQSATLAPSYSLYQQWYTMYWSLIEYRRSNYEASHTSAVAAAGLMDAFPSSMATARVLQAMSAKQLGKQDEYAQLMRAVISLHPKLEIGNWNTNEAAQYLIFEYLLEEAEMLDPEVANKLKDSP